MRGSAPIRDILGKKIVVNGRPLTIIGVSQAGFDGVEPGRAPQIRIPITMKDDLPRADFGRLNTDRFRWTEVFGRLKPGISIEKAQAGLQPLFHQIIESRSDGEAVRQGVAIRKAGIPAHVDGGDAGVEGPVGPAQDIFQAAVRADGESWDWCC